VTILALALVLADLPASQQVPTAAPGIVIPARTRVQLSTVDPLDSRTVKQGQRFSLRVSEDVTVDSVAVIPRGTPAIGEVEAVSGKGMVGKPGRLVLRPLFIELSGERINLIGTSDEHGADATAGVAAGSLLLSAWGIFITGKSASVPAGSPVPARVRSDVSVPAPVVTATAVTEAQSSDGKTDKH